MMRNVILQVIAKHYLLAKMHLIVTLFVQEYYKMST